MTSTTDLLVATLTQIADRAAQAQRSLAEGRSKNGATALKAIELEALDALRHAAADAELAEELDHVRDRQAAA